VEKARAMMQGYTAPNDVIKETKELLSRQSPPLKLPAKHNERQRQTLLEIRAVIEELLERLG
jgi:hypothetical protein